MQGLADGYFILPYTIGDYLSHKFAEPKTDINAPEFVEAEKKVEERIAKVFSVKGTETVDSIHKKLGHIMWEYVGMARNEAGLKTALEKIPALRAEFWENVNVLGSEGSFNQNLERAGRVADFLEFAEVLTLDALHRKESCGGHFREESQTPEGEAKRDDENFCYVGAWEYKGDGIAPELSKEPLTFDNVHLATRSYK